MKLPSHGDGASTSKGKSKVKYRDSSDEDDFAEARSLDSDIDGGISDDDGVPKRRKENTSGGWGSHRSEKAEEEDGERYRDADIQNVIGMEPGKIEFTGSIAEFFGKKKDRPVLLWKVFEQENNKWIKENLNREIDLINQDEASMHTREPSDDFIIPLLRFQTEWLDWAWNQEESTARGGILADEMGMGKTLQAIALVLLRRSISIGTHLPSSSGSSSGELPPIKGTLVICPSAGVDQWVREINRSTLKGSTNVLVYDGGKRAKKLPYLSDYDFVIATYATVEAEFRKYVTKDKCQYCKKVYANALRLEIHLYSCHSDIWAVEQLKSKKMLELEVHTSKINRDKGKNKGQISPEGKSIFHSVAWERIILDEAHAIKRRSSNTAKAVLALQSRYKWALSGTPLQNCVDEFYVLIRFLQILPYSYYFCMDCDCLTLDNGTTPECLVCSHEYDRHFCWWNRYVSIPLQKYGMKTGNRGPTVLLHRKILKSFMLRRTKNGRIADLSIPHRTETLRRDSLDAYEQDYYTALQNENRAQFNTYVEAGALMNHYSHLLGLLTGLRQAVNHPYLVEYPKPKTSDPPKKQRSKTTIEGFKPSSILNRIQLDKFQTSSKIDALMEEIRFMFERDGSAKAIVFSQFLPFLDLIHYALRKSGVPCVQLDGSMTKKAKATAIKNFTEDPSCRIFLASIKAGGVALNLTAASHVFLMEPCWNPAIEQQAQARIHRIGQHKPTRVVRFIMENTIEERMLRLQERKALIFEGMVGGSLEALERVIQENDLRFLFVS